MANADVLARSGISYPLAIEIARQMTAGAGSGDARRLMTLGLGGMQSTELAAQVNAAAFSAHKLAAAMFNPSIAKLLKDHSGL